MTHVNQRPKNFKFRVFATEAFIYELADLLAVADFLVVANACGVLKKRSCIGPIFLEYARQAKCREYVDRVLWSTCSVSRARMNERQEMICQRWIKRTPPFDGRAFWKAFEDDQIPPPPLRKEHGICLEFPGGSQKFQLCTSMLTEGGYTCNVSVHSAGVYMQKYIEHNPEIVDRLAQSETDPREITQFLALAKAFAKLVRDVSRAAAADAFLEDRELCFVHRVATMPEVLGFASSMAFPAPPALDHCCGRLRGDLHLIAVVVEYLLRDCSRLLFFRSPVKSGVVAASHPQIKKRGCRFIKQGAEGIPYLNLKHLYLRAVQMGEQLYAASLEGYNFVYTRPVETVNATDLLRGTYDSDVANQRRYQVAYSGKKQAYVVQFYQVQGSESPDRFNIRAYSAITLVSGRLDLEVADLNGEKQAFVLKEKGHFLVPQDFAVKLIYTEPAMFAIIRTVVYELAPEDDEIRYTLSSPRLKLLLTPNSVKEIEKIDNHLAQWDGISKLSLLLVKLLSPDLAHHNVNFVIG